MTDEPIFAASECENGHLTYPSHARCPECGQPQTETIELADREGEVVTWTRVGTSPVGVREPNTLAIVEFSIGDRTVRALGSTTDDVAVGQTVKPVYVEELREPEQGIRDQRSQSWDGYRFEPVE